jgi:anti-sigma factor RsiW
MSNSDQPLSPSEIELMAYLDGQLTPEQAAAFERAHPEAAAEKARAQQLRSLLRSSEAPALPNAEFFNRQILREITPKPSVASKPEEPFSLWRLFLAGATCLLLALGVYQQFVPDDARRPAYLAEVISMKTGDSALTSRVIQEDGLTMVMIDGLEPISEEFILN